MKTKLKLSKPLAFFDIESTGLNRSTDRIIDLAIIKVMPDGSREEYNFRVNPGKPIPADSTAVHGIRDEDVKDCPPFNDIAAEVVACLDGCDLAGFNVLHFDIPVLEAAFRRAEVDFSMKDRRVIDAQRIFHRKEPRDLSAALAFYCNDTHADAHSALEDTAVTIRVLEGQYECYDDLPDDIEALAEFCNPPNPNWVDREGKLAWDADNDAAINFGQKQGAKLKELALSDAGYLKWILRKDFSHDTQEIVRNALAGQFPVRTK